MSVTTARVPSSPNDAAPKARPLTPPRVGARGPQGLSAGDLVRAAAKSDAGAWEGLVERFGGLVWAVARAHDLNPADAADVSQVVWLRLLDHLDRLREPDRIGSWLAQTCRRECLRLLRQRKRVTVTDDAETLDAGRDGSSEVHLALATRERNVALRKVIETLPVHHKALLRVMMVDPSPSYEEVSAALGIPVGSIGPTRRRCLELLQRKCSLAGIQPG